MTKQAKVPIDLSGKDVSGDAAMQKVIAAQARANDCLREVAALRKDRADLLAEYTDMRNARPIAKLSARKATATKANSVRVSFGDVHGMMMDAAAVNALLADVKRLDPDEIVIGGDLLDCGGWLAKHHPIGFIALCDYTYQEDVDAANGFLDELIRAAPRAEIHYLEGNHEDRVERWIVDQVMASKRDAAFLHSLASPRALLRLQDRGIRYYTRSEIYGDGLPRGWIRLGKMFFTHSLTYSKNAARDAAQKTAGNVTYFCTHREDSATVVYPSVGLVKAFNPGCLCKMQPIWKHSDPTSWSQGYAVDYIAASGNFQRIHVPIWRGESLAVAMVERFKS
jgi:hypothetical protein